MNYSRDDFRKMETDPLLRRQYFWQIGTRALLRSRGTTGEDAEMDRHMGEYILANIDELVASGKTIETLADFMD